MFGRDPENYMMAAVELWKHNAMCVEMLPRYSGLSLSHFDLLFPSCTVRTDQFELKSWINARSLSSNQNKEQSVTLVR